LRITQRRIIRPYKCFAYPIIPIFFIVGNMWIVGFSLWVNPVVFLYAGATLAVGACVEMLYRFRIYNAVDKDSKTPEADVCNTTSAAGYPMCEQE